MRIAGVYTIALVFFVIFLSSFSIAQKQVVRGKVTGVGGPLQGATIDAAGVTSVTDIKGEFQIELLPGDYTLEVTHAGYQKIIRRILVVEGTRVMLDFIMTAEQTMGEIVILGSRSLVQRSNLTTAVPVDLVSASQLFGTGQTTVTQMLQSAIPSINASRQLVHEPVTLRGMDPDQILLLVNGKRYHNLAFVNWGGVRGMLGRGAVSNDLNSIPFSAIESIEVLRDGASAQYGSDAIAGVLNIKLKKSVALTTVQLQAGQFYEQDGKNLTLAANRGFSLGTNGFMNLSGSFRFQDPTFRGGMYKGTVYSNSVGTDDSIVRARNFDRQRPSNAGNSEHHSFALAMNGEYSRSKKAGLFWNAIFSQRKSIFITGFIFPKNQSLINPELFPDGIKAKPVNHSNDVSATIGLREQIGHDWRCELSSSYGMNKGIYFNKETNNASQYFLLGKNAPTSFYTGSLFYGQFITDLNFSKNFLKPHRTGNADIGIEWRQEHFRIAEGEEASWNNYDTSGRKQGGSGGLVFSPADAISGGRNVVSVYVDIESELPNRFLFDVASRYEYYSDFGGNLAGKVAMRYKFSKNFILRGSISNGFRAPSLQQRYFSLTRLGLSTSGALSTLGIFRNNSRVGAALGIPSLQAERSINLSGGFAMIFQPHVSLTFDAYWIQVKNRIVLSGAFDRTSNYNVDSLLNTLTNVNLVQVFTNAVNTRTSGADLILNGHWKIGKDDFKIVLAANLTRTVPFGAVKVAGNLKPDSLNSNTLFPRSEIGRIRFGQPRDKMILLLEYQKKRIGIQLRNTRFGRTAILSNNLSRNDDENFAAKILTDLLLRYAPNNWLTINLGANNIFDIYPDRIRDYRNTTEGMYIYGQEATPFGISGGFYFLNFEVKW